MIAYDLKCQNNHTFEGWFENAVAFKKQRKAGLIGCPICDDTQITRIPSTFAIKGSSAPNPTVTPQINHKANQKAMARAIAHYVDQNFDNVGADFASEALKIHYGVNAPRNIRGVSTPQEEETLRKEGVAFVKVPVPAENTSPDPDSGTEN